MERKVLSTNNDSRFYSVKEFIEYFQNKDEAKTTREICLPV